MCGYKSTRAKGEKTLKRKCIAIFGFVFLFLMCVVRVSLAQQKALTNADVINMVKGGLAESVVMSAIQLNAPNYDVSPAALIALKKAGVTGKEQEAMLAAMKAAATPPAQPAGTSSTPRPTTTAADGQRANSGTAWRMPTVAVLQGGSSQPLTLEKTQLAQTKAKPTSISSLASDSVVTQALQGGIGTATYGVASKVASPVGGATVQQAGGLFSNAMAHRKPAVTYVWGVPNPSSGSVFQNYLPTFAVNFAGAPGINPDEYEPAIVKLTPAQNTCRIVGATQGKEDAKASPAADWEIYSSFLEERVPAAAQKLKSGEYKLTPGSPLLPGEYGVVLRPVSKTKKFSGADVARGQGDGFVFGAVWSFQIAIAQ
jgi:hypothetical protein